MVIYLKTTIQKKLEEGFKSGKKGMSRQEGSHPFMGSEGSLIKPSSKLSGFLGPRNINYSCSPKIYLIDNFKWQCFFHYGHKIEHTPHLKKGSQLNHFAKTFTQKFSNLLKAPLPPAQTKLFRTHLKETVRMPTMN